MEALLSAAPFSVAVADSSHVSAARLGVQHLAQVLDFDATGAGRAAIVVTEAVTNMLKHAKGGTLAARGLARGDALGVELLAIDNGPGMRDFAASARDGHSTAGTPGNGLGAIQRLSDEFDFYTQPGEGTVLRMVLWNRPPPAAHDPYEVGAVTIPKTGETACGDAWAMEPHSQGATFMVADGLGHGPEASRAAASAMDVLHRHPQHSALRLLDLAHAKLRPTRGAALAVLRHEAGSGEIVFAGVGNIAACVVEGDVRRAMVSHNGIVGHNMHKSQEYRYPWPRHALLVAHSDGLESQWNLAAFPGLAARHAAVIAATLFRKHSRKRDDVTVVVARSTR
jgi:anti-sigma regulatory factor (Ser/Thr protein kinase)